MARSYNTRQKMLVQKTLMESGSHAVTAEELSARLAEAGERVGKTTVYRQLERLIQQGEARALPGSEGMLYQYVGDVSRCSHHLHCQCETCGRLFHVECDFLTSLSGHLLDKHDFSLNPGETILKGQCRLCQEGEAYGASEA